ncbi:hypothetical protein [Streptomyces sp. NPDC050121]|uniref:hypothetical protein n=1 Tax=Streptomyces sp. NPDC050121 TaxID=3365601 RepID=UPI00378EDB7B
MEELGFVSARMSEVQWAFDPFGVTMEPPCLDGTEGEIDALLRRRLVDDPDPADVIVVHLIGHGRRDRNGRLGLVAHDDRVVDVDRWIEKAQQEIARGGNQRRVVFLVDTCSAGTATGRQSLAEQNSERGVWALGATISSLPTEQGRFSHWIATALQQVWDEDFTLNDDSVNFTEFVRKLVAVGRRVNSSWRISLGFNLEQGDGDWPFLPNPKTAGLSPEQLRMERRSLGYVPGEEDLRKDLGTRIAAGEEVEDAVYFYDRASGRGLVSADGREGFFSGRAAQLRQYVEWQAGDGPLLTVTGAAGAGKSGLLGLIVCAAHPELRDRCHELWAQAGPGLPEVPDMVAVHARQRSGQQLVDRIVRLADLRPPRDEEQDEREGKGVGKAEEQEVHWTPRLLRKALEQEGKKRLLVIDAVDESSNPQSVLDLVAVLVAPQKRRSRAGAAPCRVLFGGRREVVDALYFNADMADFTGESIDLDSADPTTVEEDVRRYIERLLRTTEPYVTGTSACFVELLAKLGAKRIVDGVRADSPWGPFLLAGLYAHYLLTLQTPPENETLARAYGGQASADLPQLLEAVLTEHPAARAVLAVLARSKGDGMPRVTLGRCLRAFNAHDITDAELERTLREASPYLRTGADRESKTLYRIFQQGLADYLRDHPFSSDPVDEQQSLALERDLLGRVVGPFMAGHAGDSADRWHSAEPYVLQHALGHVMAADAPEVAEALLTDPYFLIRFDARQDHRAIDLCGSAEAAAYRRLLTASWPAHGKLRSAADRASVFVYDADRLGMPDHRTLFAGIVPHVALQPEAAAHSLVWATGGRYDDTSQFIETEAEYGPVAISPDGSLFALRTGSGVQLLETETWRQVERVPAQSLSGLINCIVFSPDGRFLAFSTGTWTRNVQLWDVHNRVFLGKPWEEDTFRTGTPMGLAFSPDGRLLAVASAELDVSVWHISDSGPVEANRLPQSKEAVDVLFSPDGRLLAACGGEGTTLWHTETWEPVSLTTAETQAVAFSSDGRLLALLHSDAVTLWSCGTFQRTDRIPLGETSSGENLSFSGDGSLLAVTEWRTVRVIDLAAKEEVGNLGGNGHIFGAVFHPAQPALLVSSHSDGRLRLWNRFTQRTDVPQLTRFHSVDAVTSPDGRLVAAVDQDDLLILHDAVTGRRLETVYLGPSSPSADLRFSPDSRTIVAVVRGNRFHVVRLGSTPPTNDVLHIGSGSVLAMAFSPDSRCFALSSEEAGSKTFAVKVWEIETLRPTHRIPLPDSPDVIDFAGPDRLLVAIDGALAVYDCPTDTSEESPA